MRHHIISMRPSELRDQTIVPFPEKGSYETLALGGRGRVASFQKSSCDEMTCTGNTTGVRHRAEGYEAPSLDCNAAAIAEQLSTVYKSTLPSTFLGDISFSPQQDLQVNQSPYPFLTFTSYRLWQPVFSRTLPLFTSPSQSLSANTTNNLERSFLTINPHTHKHHHTKIIINICHHGQRTFHRNRASC